MPANPPRRDCSRWMLAIGVSVPIVFTSGTTTTDVVADWSHSVQRSMTRIPNNTTIMTFMVSPPTNPSDQSLSDFRNNLITTKPVSSSCCVASADKTGSEAIVRLGDCDQRLSFGAESIPSRPALATSARSASSPAAPRWVAAIFPSRSRTT